LIVIDAKRERASIKEASRLGIPIIALVDTNTDPRGINFVIPANDDSPKSIKFIIDYLDSRIQDGKKKFKETKPEAKTAPVKAQAVEAKPEIAHVTVPSDEVSEHEPKRSGGKSVVKRSPSRSADRK
jgi:small subunit ribosomal protein S2